MNKPRLKKIKTLANEIDELTAEILSANEDLQSLLSEEEDYHDTMPENLQYSYQGERSEEAIDVLTNGTSGIEDAIGKIEEAISSINKEVDNIFDITGDIHMLE